MSSEIKSQTPLLKSSPELAPGFLLKFWNGWKRVGLFIGKVNLYILTFVVYWSIFALTSIIAKILRRDFLNIRKTKGMETYWVKIPEIEATMENSKRQF
jgi:hypothetical protein